MSIPTFYQEVIARVGKSDPHIQPADVIAVCLQESTGDPVFHPSDPLYRDNINAAIKETTLPEALLLDALLIKSGPYKGQISKFRFEPSYWLWTKSQQLPSPTLRFLCSCSFGVGQQMMRWVLPPKKTDWLPFIENFKGDVDVQVTYVMLKLRSLLIQTDGSLYKAYKAYNSGDPNSKDDAVTARALHVKKLRDIVEQQLKG